MKPIKWKCPYCETSFDESYVRCTECGNKRSPRFEVDANGKWLATDPTDGHSKIGSAKKYVEWRKRNVQS